LDVFCLQDLLLSAPGTPPLLTADLLASGLFGAHEACPETFDAVEEKTAGEKTVLRLGALPLAFDMETGRTMNEKDAGGGFIDLLPARTGGTDERFVEFILPDAETLHPFPERRFLVL